MTLRLTIAVAAAWAAPLVGCTVDDAGLFDDVGAGGEPAKEQEEAIADGSPFAAPWAAILSRADGSSCTGVLIAPRVVLTAAHCVPLAGKVSEGDRIVLPHAGVEPAAIGAYARYRDANGKVHDGTLDGEPGSADLEEHDAAVVVLVHPVELARYPTRSVQGAVAGAAVYAVGKTSAWEQGVSFLQSPPDDLEVVSSLNYKIHRPFGDPYLEGGDSGGPWLRVGTWEIVALSRSVGHASYGYRVDVSACWIARQVEAFGGEGHQVPAAPALSEVCS